MIEITRHVVQDFFARKPLFLRDVPVHVGHEQGTGVNGVQDVVGKDRLRGVLHGILVVNSKVLQIPLRIRDAIAPIRAGGWPAAIPKANALPLPISLTASSALVSFCSVQTSRARHRSSSPRSRIDFPFVNNTASVSAMFKTIWNRLAH